MRSMSTSVFAGAAASIGIAIVSVFTMYAAASYAVSAPSSRMKCLLPGDAHGKTSKKRYLIDGQNNFIRGKGITGQWDMNRKMKIRT